jgi:four helix bundle protein
VTEGKKPDDLRSRTKQFALRIIRLFVALPKTTEGQVIGKQLLRSGTSVGAHYREATRARSSAEFISKLEGGLQELDESAYWTELLSESGIVASSRLTELQKPTSSPRSSPLASKRQNKERQSRRTDFILHPSAFILHPSLNTLRYS